MHVPVRVYRLVRFFNKLVVSLRPSCLVIFAVPSKYAVLRPSILVFYFNNKIGDARICFKF